MSSGFISEAELAERRRVRQEQWEKVRQPHQPLEAPQEEYDGRSLYERLEVEKQKKQLEYEEAHRLKNMIKGLDDDEVEFLHLVDRSKVEEERKKMAEEEREMADFRSKVENLEEENSSMRIRKQLIHSSSGASKSTDESHSDTVAHSKPSSQSSQCRLLAGAVIKKRAATSSSSGCDVAASNHNQSDSQPPPPKINKTGEEEERSERMGALRCVGVLPGLGHYRAESSDELDSDESSEIEETTTSTSCSSSTLSSSSSFVQFDLVGRKISPKVHVTDN